MRHQVLFEDRKDAGCQLADRLGKYRSDDVIVLALPRGGVPVAYEIARALGAPLDVIVARKLGAPMQPELGIGAIAPGGVMLVDERRVAALGLSDEDLEAVAEKERAEVERRLNRYRGDGLPEVRGRTVILVDDGLATGVTARAAIHAVRRLGPARVVLAIPVCAAETAAMLADEVEDLFCVSTPEQFVAVGVWYGDFSQTTDAEVIELLEEAEGYVTPGELGER